MSGFNTYETHQVSLRQAGRNDGRKLSPNQSFLNRQHQAIKKIVANPKNVINPTTSVTVVSITPPAMAGSMP